MRRRARKGATEATVADRLARAAGLDASGFSRSAVARAVDQRRRAVGASTVDAYCDAVSADPAEAARFGHEVIARYSAFFRNEDHWWAVGESLRAALAGAGAPRCWSAGCASGEEAYTIAMLVGETFGTDALAGASVYGTDVDDEALGYAQRGVYERDEVATVPSRLRARYFVRRGPAFEVAPALRNAVTFEHHDLASPPPVADLHLVVCRHTLMYLDPDARTRATVNLVSALKPGGLLFVERSDGVSASPDAFGLASAAGAVTPLSGLPVFVKPAR